MEQNQYYGYIYRAIVINENSHLNGHTYIGQHKYNDKSNELDNTYYSSSSRLKNEYFPYYGYKGIIIECIDWAENKKLLDELEKYYIIEERKILGEFCLNVAEGGTGGDCVSKLDEDKRKKWINKLRKYNKEKYEDQNERDKISIATKKALNKPEIRAKHLAALKKYREEHPEVIENLKRVQIKRWEDPNQHKKMSDRMNKIYEDQNERDKISERFNGMKWYNNGKINKRFKQKPDDDKWIEGRIKNNKKIKYNMWNNGEIQTIYFTQPGPEWKKGRLYYDIPSDWEWYTNGLFNIRYKECPEGFKKGKVEYLKLKNDYKKFIIEHPNLNK